MPDSGQIGSSTTIATTDPYRQPQYFFDPSDVDPPVGLSGGHVVYYSVFAFTRRVKDETGGANCMNLNRHLHEYLLGRANIWFTMELSELERAGLTTSTSLWCQELVGRFGGGRYNIRQGRYATIGPTAEYGEGPLARVDSSNDSMERPMVIVNSRPDRSKRPVIIVDLESEEEDSNKKDGIESPRGIVNSRPDRIKRPVIIVDLESEDEDSDKKDSSE